MHYEYVLTILIVDIPIVSIDPQVVNALLTQLDKLRHKKNVLVVSTSNLAKAIGQLKNLGLP
jgi:ABC-type Mn2+/Zn2+ transport system ATPase subunit